MIEPSFKVEYLHESTKTIWVADREIDEREKSEFDAASIEELVKLGYIFSRNAVIIDFNSKDFDS